MKKNHLLVTMKRIEIWEETHLRGIFYGTLTFQQSSMISIARHVQKEVIRSFKKSHFGHVTSYEPTHNFKKMVRV